MTNGEKIREVFPNARIGYHKATDLVDEYVTVSINGCDICQDYSMEWWNAEYKEPIEKCKWIKYDHRTMCPKEHIDVDSPYWRIPENRMETLKYCPYCGKEIEVEE